MDFKKELKSYKAKIDKALIERLELEKERAKKVNFANKKILDFIIDFCERGGKRIRPLLLIKGYEAVGKKLTQEIIRVSICIELLEAYLLIHDDIIDRDGLRRGGPSFHKMTSKWKKNSHFGLSSAIIAGDMLGSLAAQVIIESKFSEHFKLRALSEFIDAELCCFHGELYDVILEQEEATEEDFFRMVDLKTSSYTTKAPLVIGAILGGGKEKEIETLREYGRLLGRAFQIVDDILGTFGDKKITGKPTASDIKQGKKTLLLLYALQKATPKDIAFLHNSVGNRRLKKQDLQRVKEIFIRTGALDYARKKISQYTEKAKEILNFFPSEKVTFLSQLADFIRDRDF
jgi:geranylgeranyl diphosphate synthase type I